jgi:ribosomal-protein-serine acetyltransferase
MFSLRVDDEIELGLLEDRHARPLFELMEQSREHLRAWLPTLGNLKSVEEVESFIKEALQRFANHNGFQVGIWYRGELAGIIGYKYWDWTAGQTELAYLLGQKYTGRGIMTRAAYQLVEYAFNDLGLNRVEIRCATGNATSRAVPERLGFTREVILRQVFRKYDQLLDLAVYGMLAGDWQRPEAGEQ